MEMPLLLQLILLRLFLFAERNQLMRQWAERDGDGMMAFVAEKDFEYERGKERSVECCWRNYLGTPWARTSFIFCSSNVLNGMTSLVTLFNVMASFLTSWEKRNRRGWARHMLISLRWIPKMIEQNQDLFWQGNKSWCDPAINVRSIITSCTRADRAATPF